jgi:hypothetical protein
MSDIFQEVDEEVRRDKALEFWNKYQNYLIALALLVVVATGGWRFWQYRQKQAAEAAGAAFHAALLLDDQGKAAEAKAALVKLQADAPRGYATLSRFVEAGLQTKKDPKAGAAAFDALAADDSLDPLLRETARLRAALARLDAGETDAAKAALTPLAASGAYNQTARLTLASIALAAKDYAGAGKWLDEVVADAEAPQADRRTAMTLLGLVAAQGVKPKP